MDQTNNVNGPDTFDDPPNIMDMIGSDSQEEKKESLLESSKILKDLASYVKMMRDYEDRIVQAEGVLKQLTDAYREINEQIIPDLFDEIGLSQIKLEDGSKVEVSRDYATAITKDKALGCFAWLRDHGFESLIKHEVSVKIKKGEDEKYKKVLDALADLKLVYADTNSVHPSTLKAFVREQIEAGKDFPMELFSVFPVRKTKVKL